MAQQFRKIKALFLLMCFIAPMGLTYAVLKMKQWQVREQVEQQILQGVDKGELVELTFTLEESAGLKWEHDREFEYKGQSYDVVEKEVHEDSVTYYVWWDKIETRIKSQLADLVAKALNQDEDQQQNQDELSQLLKNLIKNAKVNINSPTVHDHKRQYGQFITFYDPLSWAPPVPPPLSC